MRIGKWSFLLYYATSVTSSLRAAVLVLWLKLSAWKGGDRGFEPHSDLEVSKKQNVSSPPTRKDSIMWGTSVTERYRARPQNGARARMSNPVSGG